MSTYYLYLCKEEMFIEIELKIKYYWFCLPVQWVVQMQVFSHYQLEQRHKHHLARTLGAC